MRRLSYTAIITSWVLLLLACPPRLRSRQQPTAATIESSRKLRDVSAEWDKAQNEYQSALRATKSAAEFQRVSSEKRPDPKPYAVRFMKLADDYPGTYAEAASLYWVISHAEGTEYARDAIPRLKKGPVTKADLRLLWGLFFIHGGHRAAAIRDLTPLVYDRVAKEPDHPKAPDLLIWVCQATAKNDGSAEGDKLLRKASDLLVSRYPDAKYLWQFCPLLERSEDPAWAEKHLRTILKKNQVPAAKVLAAFTLATVLQDKGADSQAEAKRLYERVMKEAGPAAKEWGRAERENSTRHRESYHEFMGEENLTSRAKAQLREMKARGLGKPAPELKGEDVDGKPLRLSDLRGKVVLLSFWATWCPPCMALVPRERMLVRRMDGKPFAVLGVNGDDDPADARKAVAAKKMSWRSFKDKRSEGDAISKEWGVPAWPTLYLIDHKGVILKRWVGTPPRDALEREVALAVSAAGAEKK
jgi:thiol-disulfide isomerase/thioredoxin